MGIDIKKIAFVLPNFSAGGAERVMLTIANHLDRRRFQPMIIVFNDEGSLRSIVAPDIPVVSLKSRRVSQGVFAFIRAVHKDSPDLILSTMAHLNMFVLLARIFFPKIPVVAREAVTPSYFSDNLLKRVLLTLSYYILYPFADRIISPTRLVFDQMPKFLKLWPKKLHVIYNPVNTDFITTRINKDFRQNLARVDQKLFVGAGRLVSQKGFDLLIDALRDWKHRDNWRLVILGEGADYQELKQMIKDSDLHQITLVGFESVPWNYFSAADAFLLPSRHEGLPNVALEALALGTPVIALESAGGIAEIAAQATPGSVLIAKDMKQFQALMAAVMPMDATISRKNLLFSSFSLDAVVASYQDIFAELTAP